MSTFSINESLFVIDMEDEKPRILPQGELLPDGIKIDNERDQCEDFAFYVSEDGRFDILAVRPHLAERWLQDGYLTTRMLQKHFNAQDELDCYLLISPSSHLLARMTDLRAHSSAYYAHVVATAIWHTRNKDQFINLRDGILCELYGVVLPTYTKTPQLADLSILCNALRGQYAPEDLRNNEDFKREGKFGGLSLMTFNQALKEHQMQPDTVEPYFQVGEYIDDFIQMAPHTMITGALELKEEYQIYATTTDMLLLAMSPAWAHELIERNLVLSMDLKSVQIDREIIRVLTLPRRFALESLNNRHYGINQSNAFDLALALQRARRQMPVAQMQDALYVQALGLVLPTKFTGGNSAKDEALIREVLTCGPFAQSPFLDDVMYSAVAIVRA